MDISKCFRGSLRFQDNENRLEYILKDENEKQCFRIRISVLKLSLGEVNRQFYGRKLRFYGSASNLQPQNQ